MPESMASHAPTNADLRDSLASIVEATTDLVAMATPDGSITYVNGAGLALLGLPPGAPLPRHVRDLHPEWANEIVMKEAIAAAIEHGHWRGEAALAQSNGREVPVSEVILSHRHATTGAVESVSIVARDVSDQKRAQTAQIEWANRYEAAIRSSGQLLFDWSPVTGELTFGGDVENFLGYRASELQGGLQRFRELIVPEDLERFDAEVDRVSATRDPFRLDFRILQKNGAEIVVAANGHFFLDRQGNFHRMVGFLADVTSQRRAEAALRAAQESLEARVAARTAELDAASADLRDSAVQQEMVAALGHHALTGVEFKRLVQEAAHLVRSTMHVDYCSVLEVAHTGDELHCIAESGWPDPSLTSVPGGTKSQSGYTLIVRSPVTMEDSRTETRFEVSEEAKCSGARSCLTVLIDSDERPIGVLCAFGIKPRKFDPDDVNFLQSVANVLSAAWDRMRAEESVRFAREQAETANRAKSEFLSRMSHELRTPLNAILGFSQLLELDHPTPSQAESIDHIIRAGKHLLSLINEVLDISRIECGRLALTPEPVELEGLLRQAVDSVASIAEHHEVTVVLDDSCGLNPIVVADRQRLLQVFQNLLANGAKYNRPGGRVLVSCSELRGNSVRISIADTGRGIPEDKLARLFLPFERLGAESTEVEGSGIGLALSRGIIKALNGELGVHSVEGKGSIFWVVLPVMVANAPETDAVETARAAEAAPSSTVAGAAPSNVSVLLYIEDQDLNLRLAERIFASQPEYRLLTAADGTTGIATATAARPDLILLDMNLPDMTGAEVLRRLKEQPETASIPVVLVSAEVMDDRIVEIRKQGAAGYITKPYRVPQLLGTVAEVLASRA